MALVVYVILFSVFLVYTLAQAWPSESSPLSPVEFLSWTFAISSNVRLFLIVALAGALGSMVHVLRSLYWYVGHRDLP